MNKINVYHTQTIIFIIEIAIITGIHRETYHGGRFLVDQCAVEVKRGDLVDRRVGRTLADHQEEIFEALPSTRELRLQRVEGTRRAGGGGGDGGRWREMEGDGGRWKEMEGDGGRWKEMGDYKRPERGPAPSISPARTAAFSTLTFLVAGEVLLWALAFAGAFFFFFLGCS